MTTSKKKLLTTEPLTNKYETEWKHDYLEPQDYLHFKANTPIETVVPQLEYQLNRIYPDLNVDYNAKSMSTFSRLYRNLISHYKGWRVFYKKPTESSNYHSITEKIGYKPRGPKQSFKQTVFKNRMRWTHELNPLVESVELDGVNNSDTIAQRLNANLKKTGFKPYLKSFASNVDGLHKEYKELIKPSFIGYDFQDKPTWQEFLKNLEIVNHYCQKLNVANSNDYLVTSANISQILQKNTKTAKGWSLEILNKK